MGSVLAVDARLPGRERPRGRPSAAAAFARRELDADLIEKDRASAFSRESWQKCADFGVLALPLGAWAAAHADVYGLRALWIVLVGLNLVTAIAYVVWFRLGTWASTVLK